MTTRRMFIKIILARGASFQSLANPYFRETPQPGPTLDDLALRRRKRSEVDLAKTLGTHTTIAAMSEDIAQALTEHRS